MVEKVYLSEAEKGDLQAVIRSGLRAKVDQWTVARIALARSIQEVDPPVASEFAANSQKHGGVELHPRQLTGYGRPEADYTDAFRAILSVYEGQDLFADEEAFQDLLQRHIRRGLKLIKKEWNESQDFAQYLLQQLYFDEITDADESKARPEASTKVVDALEQLGIGARVVDQSEGPRLTRFTLELAELDDLDRLRRGLGKLAFALGHNQDAVTSSIAPGDKRVFLFVPRPPSTWKTVTWYASGVGRLARGDANR